MGWMSNEQGLEKTRANYVPLTPLSHLKRASIAFPNRLALSYRLKKYNYLQYHQRVTLLASSLVGRGISPGDVIATILPNIPAQVEAHFGIPAAGAVINTINTRLDVKTVAYIFDHGEAKIVLVDTQFLSLAKQAKDMCTGLGPEIIEVEDKSAGFPKSGDHLEYEELLHTGNKNFSWRLPQDEWESLSLNYTSGTTGQPKGVSMPSPWSLFDDDGYSCKLEITVISQAINHCPVVPLQWMESYLDDANARWSSLLL